MCNLRGSAAVQSEKIIDLSLETFLWRDHPSTETTLVSGLFLGCCCAYGHETCQTHPRGYADVQSEKIIDLSQETSLSEDHPSKETTLVSGLFSTF